MNRSPHGLVLSLAFFATAGLCVAVQAATPAELLGKYSTQAGNAPSPERGQRFFSTKFPGTFDWSCSTCHGPVPTTAGKDDVTKKPIQPLAPAFNATRFTDATRVEYMFRVNCKDVVGRECTAAEKADVLSWLLTLKP